MAVSAHKPSGPRPASPCLCLLTFPSSLKMLSSLKSFVGPRPSPEESRPDQGWDANPLAGWAAGGSGRPSSGLPDALPQKLTGSAKSGCASPSQLCSPSSLLPALPPFPPPHCAKCKQEPLLPAAEARTAPLGFPQQSSDNSKGGPELSASHSNSLPESIHLLIC